MNQDLTQSNLSIARDGVTIHISGPAWLIKDVYERETAPTIRIESANPEAPATPKDWPVFQLGDRVRYAGSSLVGTIEGTDRAPRIYSVRYDGGRLQEHVGVMLENVGGGPAAEPTIEALAQQEPAPKRRRGRPSKRVWPVIRNGKPHATRTLKTMDVGQWCELRCAKSTPYVIADRMGIEVTARTIRKGVQRVERVQ